MPRPFGTSLSLFLAASPTLCKSATYILDPNTSRLLSQLDYAEADVSWTYHADRDCDPEDGLKEQTALCLPCCHHTQDKPPSMDDAPLDEKACHALEEYLTSFK
ncbi:hypothetical protein ACMYSQ_012342 [Aspergillus niger]